jgi:hypothetical protein
MVPLLVAGAAFLVQDVLKERTPADAVKLAAEAMKKVEGCRVALNVRGTGLAEEFSGIMRPKDALAHLTGKIDLWCREHVTVLGASGRKLEEAEEGELRVAGPAVNPAMIVREALAAAPGAFDAAEKVGEVDCRVLTAAATAEQKKVQMALMFQKLRGSVEASLANRLDPEASVSSYRIWIARKDGRVMKVVWEVQPKISGAGVVGLGALAGAANKVQAVYTVTLSEFDKKADLKPPEAVQKAFK